MFLNLQAFAFTGQIRNFPENVVVAYFFNLQYIGMPGQGRSASFWRCKCSAEIGSAEGCPNLGDLGASPPENPQNSEELFDK